MFFGFQIRPNGPHVDRGGGVPRRRREGHQLVAGHALGDLGGIHLGQRSGLGLRRPPEKPSVRRRAPSHVVFGMVLEVSMSMSEGSSPKDLVLCFVTFLLAAGKLPAYEGTWKKKSQAERHSFPCVLGG